ncbi:ferritin-like domain-containing protein [Brevibacillus sp. GCM10020057]|uniref:ferritin-like domain-containing protein n=1 Tax=Brevibacillus sp. GCM10020057 TaxID=3317327 RepID=UPI0036301D8D
MPTIMSSAPFTKAPIPEPPRVITTKDMSYLKDALSWELNAFKKLHAFAQMATDPEVKQCLEKAGRMHQQHYQKLLTHLQNNNASIMATIPQTQSQQQQPQMQ